VLYTFHFYAIKYPLAVLLADFIASNSCVVEFLFPLLVSNFQLMIVSYCISIFLV